ncbi:hypothetical protein RRF57_009935 [Xylaria bambusicola]|uniref:Uncharacterized protein n=1 Tax=Xylaria bambusicola TaxID=326684 RepID=A0AAN7ZCD0_9PEZI
MAVGKTKEGESLPAKPINRDKRSAGLVYEKERIERRRAAVRAQIDSTRGAEAKEKGRELRLTELGEARAAIIDTQLLAYSHGSPGSNRHNSWWETVKHTCP